MNIKILCVIMAIALLLCGCGSTKKSNDTTGTNENAGDPDSDTQGSYFNPDNSDPTGDLTVTLPENVQGIVLPEDEFGDDIEGISSSRPLNTDVPEVTEPPVTEAPSNNGSGGTLPEHIFDEEIG